ncbi:MAG: TIGR04086 family membrane protein [Clostridium sp.]
MPEKEEFYASVPPESRFNFPACLLSLICPAFIHPDPRPVPAQAEGIPDHSSRLCSISSPASLSGLLCGTALRTRRFFWGLLTGMLYFLALLAASVLLRHGQIPELTRMLPVLACCVAGGMIGRIFS